MDILSLIGLHLGGAIAKHIIKVWLGDDFKGTVASELVEISKGIVERKFSNQTDLKQIELVAKQVVKDVQPIFKHADLNKEDRASAAIETAVTLSQSKIDADLLIKVRLNPERLKKYFIDSRPEVTEKFGTDETELYKRLIGEFSIAISKTATNLSGFDSRLASQTLYDSEQILKNLIKILQKPDEDAERFELSFRNSIKKTLDQMELFGLPRVDDVTRRQKLSVAYTSLNVDLPPLHRDSKEMVLSGRKELKNVHQIKENSGQEFLLKKFQIQLFDRGVENLPNGIGINQILNFSRRFVIRGQAGSGKSTLLQWLAVRASSQDFPPELVHWNDCIPFFIRLR